MPARYLLDAAEIRLADHDRRFTLSVPRLQIDSGDVVGLTGPSGTGKTLMLELLGLLRRPTAAAGFSIAADGDTLDLHAVWRGGAVSPPDVRAHMFGFVPQSGGLLPFLTVAENIALSQKISGVEDPDWCTDLITRLGLSDVARLRPGALSIGQRQRVAIARALAHKPAFVIADEPTAALDPDAALNVMGLLIHMARGGGSGVIISSHDLGLLDQFPMRRVALSLHSDPGAPEAISVLSPVDSVVEAPA